MARSGLPECVCENGYIGDFCQMSIDEFVYSKKLVNSSFPFLDYYFQNHTYPDKYTNGDLEYLVMYMKGMIKNFETITIDHIKTGLTYMKSCIDAHIEVVYTFSKVFYDDFFELMSRILGKFHYDKLNMETDYSMNSDEV